MVRDNPRYYRVTWHEDVRSDRFAFIDRWGWPIYYVLFGTIVSTIIYWSIFA